ncbi:uncharacterized protein [Macrobrachium rosenbergii]|uniref:uncharacterized protein n=1 Tax=Macrobrachium rosenbergii TaxID=79674 RepID=UPI0034D4DC68
MYEGAKTQVRSRVGLTEWIPVRDGLHHGSALSPYLFDLIMDVLSQGIRDQSPCCMFPDGIVLCSTNRGVAESQLEQWRKVLEDRGLMISSKKTEYLSFNEDQDFEISMEGTRSNRVEKSRHLASTVADDGNLNAEITQRVQACATAEST